MENNSFTILAIDDNQDNLTVLGAMVQDEFPGSRLLKPLSLSRVLELALAEDPDVILLDIGMSTIDGFALCRQLKGDERLRLIPVIFITDIKTGRQSRIKALEVGGEGFLAKPIDAQELCAQVRAMAKIKAANEQRCLARTEVLEMVAERTEALEQELIEHKKSEEALRKSEAYVKAILDNLPLGIAVNSVKSGVKFEYMNDNFPKFYRTTKEALAQPGAFWDSVYEDPDFREEIKKRVIDDCASGDPLRMHWEDVPITRKGAETTFISAMNTPIPGTSLMVSTVWDVTEYKRSEAALAESELRYRTLADSGQALVWTSGLDKLCDYFNEPWLIFTGRTLEQELGNGWTEGVHPEDFDRCLQVYISAFDKRERFSMEYRLRHANGEYRWIQDDGTPRFDGHGNFLGYIGHCLDITERKRAEEERQKLQERFDQAQKMESVGRLAGGVAHDFNNMLSVILGYAGMGVDMTAADDPLREFFERIRDAAERSAGLTRQLLAFARKEIVNPVPLNLNGPISDMLKMLRRIIGEDIVLEWLPGQELRPVRIDPTQIDQLLANLCVNARDSISGVGRITISTNNVFVDQEVCQGNPDLVAGDYVMLAVSDTGCGMDQETLSNIFEPFFTTKVLGQGTGLGLATVYGIVKQNDGYVSVSSQPGAGTTFSLYFPPYLGAVPAITAVIEEQPIQGDGETILLVEDVPDLLEMVCAMLRRMGYRVLVASTPAEAIALAEGHSGEVQLLVTDVIMPEMNGRELAERLRSITPSLKCLFMSGYTADLISRQGVIDMGTNFIAKPFTREQLAAKILQVIRADGETG